MPTGKHNIDGQVSRRGLLLAGGSVAVLGLVPGTGFAQPDSNPPNAYDVIVVGSGAAGCVAALFAHQANARVLVLEKGVAPGGTSAKSGGNYWIPNNFALKARQLSDSRQGFMRYAIRTTFRHLYDPTGATLGAPEEAYRLIETFYNNGSVMVDRLADMAALKSQAFMIGDQSFPDYYAELPENERPMFRVLSPLPREPDGSLGGDEMMGQLHSALAVRGIEVRLESRVVDVLFEKGRVAGVEVESADGKSHSVSASRGVVFATGGFAHNRDLVSRTQEGPVFGACAAPTSTGDIIPIAERVGAKLSNMGGAWKGPAILDDAAAYTSVPSAVFGFIADSSLFVNLEGRRCVNERRSYHDRVRAMYRYDPNTGSYPDLIQIIIYDKRAAEVFAGAAPIPPRPDGMDYVIKANDFVQLARRIGERLERLRDISANARLGPDFLANLQDSVRRFNDLAQKGVDEDFRRGSGTMDGFVPYADQSGRARAPNPTMFPLSTKGPYFAIIQGAGILDTNGGPAIDTAGRIIDYAGQPIPGMFGAGNCIASPAGNAYWAAGCTLGLAMTYGMIAGRSAGSSNGSG